MYYTLQQKSSCISNGLNKTLLASAEQIDVSPVMRYREESSICFFSAVHRVTPIYVCFSYLNRANTSKNLVLIEFSANLSVRESVEIMKCYESR